MPIFAYGKVKPLRQAKGLSQSEIAAELGISRPTYILIEQGGKEPTISQLYTLARLLGLEIGELCLNAPDLQASITDYPKFKELIAALVTHGAHHGTITKTKLSVLAYLADFAWYYAHSAPMTGATYRASTRGPVADDFFRALDDLYEGQTIAIQPSGTGLLVHAVEQLPTALLSEQELSVIHSIGAKWRTKSTSDILTFISQHVPYKSARPDNPIAYETILGQPQNLLY